MNAPGVAPSWLEARLRVYAHSLPGDPGAREAALRRARGEADPQRACAVLREALLGTSDTAGWTGELLARGGIATDPRRPLMPQRLPIVRTPMTARPFRRTVLRRALAQLVLRPVASITRRVQPLGGRVAE